jgi:dipeptidyl aminopeptidase/acylaminoacyl peptidase
LFTLNINSLKKEDLTPYQKPNAEVLKMTKDKIFADLQINDTANGIYLLDPFGVDKPKCVLRNFNLADEKYVFDTQNMIRLVTGINEHKKNVSYYRNSENEPFRIILETDMEDQILFNSFTADNKFIYAFSNLGRDKFEAVVFDPESQKEIATLLKNKQYDINGEMHFSSTTTKLLYIKYYDWKEQYYFTDKETQENFDRFFKAFPGSNISVIAETMDGHYLIYVSSDKNPGEYYLFNKTGEEMQKIASENPELAIEDLADLKPVEYTTRDGIAIHGYIMAPKNQPLKNLPTVVFAHGGPWTRDEWAYDGQFQFLANRGYLVFYMDFRGSRGYGKKHYSSSFKAWDKMNNDIADGVDWLLKKGIADKNRVAIYGGSWGGYAANYGAIFHTEKYKCAISACGPSDLFSFYRGLTEGKKKFESVMNVRMGNPKTDSLYMAKASPLRHFERARIPMLIWQGKNDPRVPWQESQQMADQLKAKGIPVTLLMKDNEGHNISKEENRLEFYRALEVFLAENMK